MSGITYHKVFQRAFGPDERSPYAYQSRLAGGVSADPEGRFSNGTTCQSQLIEIPTGLGKTAAVVLAWLWNRVLQPDEDKRKTWPRRLVYCLPMRTLVEQTRENVRQWLKNLDDLEWQPGTGHQGKIGLHIIMGGEDDGDWDIFPEREAILIGTQDMLLSRALNRGYGMSRYRWPMHFGLLNNDSLWMMDETHLMGPGLATSVQLDAFRNALWKVEKTCVTWWMSATSSASAFDSVDRSTLEIAQPERFGLTMEERQQLVASGRLGAQKRVAVGKAPKLSNREATGILDCHVGGRISLVFANTVPSALAWHDSVQQQLDKPAPRGHKKPAPPELLLLHSRYRRPDRERVLAKLRAFLALAPGNGSAVPEHPGVIVVSTQVLEAGFDLSSAKLWSEIAPWPSVIQRLGRLNREGRQPDAEGFFWMPKKEDAENGKDAPNAKRIGPYSLSELKTAQELLGDLAQRIAAGNSYAAALEHVLASAKSTDALKPAPACFIRPDDVHGLFASEPDLAGGFTNIAPYVRQEDRNADVLIYWREFKRNPGDSEATIADAARDELVAVPVYEVQRFLRTRKQPAFMWDEETEAWRRVNFTELVPGMELLLPVDAGGYSDGIGWTGRGEDKPTPLPPPSLKRNAMVRDAESAVGWQTLRAHTEAVGRASAALAARLDLTPIIREAFRVATHWHDAGKAHERWQNPLNRPSNEPWGKFEGVAKFRSGLRHEAFSLLAAWEPWLARLDGMTALALYLIATHHGKVRTVLRSSSGGDDLFGLRQGDAPLNVPGGAMVPASTKLKSFAGEGRFDWENGTYTPEQPSWIAVVAELLGPAWRDDPLIAEAVSGDEPRNLGPFRLAYLETVFRAADARASTSEFSLPEK